MKMYKNKPSKREDMNLLSIEVKIKAIQIATPHSHELAFSFRLGTVLSSMSNTYPNHNNGPT